MTKDGTQAPCLSGVQWKPWTSLEVSGNGILNEEAVLSQRAAAATNVRALRGDADGGTRTEGKRGRPL